MVNSFVNDIWDIEEEEFLSIVKKMFKYQLTNIEVYYNYVKNLFPKLIENPDDIKNFSEIPFLPIVAFKNAKVISKKVKCEQLFLSSGTTGDRSKHYVADTNIYINSFTKGFELFYGNIKEWVILALLPSYIEQGNSSLVFMVDNLIKNSKNEDSGFYLDNHEQLYNTINKLSNSPKKILLIGVSYALLDFIDKYPFLKKVKNLIIMETGGMKGRRKEMSKEALHSILKDGFKSDSIHSEYGMTELLSQAYSSKDGVFKTPPWMKVLVSDLTDPLNLARRGKVGIINVIDLANVYSCSFIKTEDLGIAYDDTTFSVIGRAYNADLRGCNLMLD